MHGNRNGSGVVSHYGDVLWIAVEAGNVRVDPLQGQHLIANTIVPWCIQVVGGQEAQHAQSVVDGDHHHSLRVAHVGGLVQKVVGLDIVLAAILELATVEVNQNGQARGSVLSVHGEQRFG